MNILGTYYIYHGHTNNVLDVKVYITNLPCSNYFLLTYIPLKGFLMYG